jgi:hypothetical protein
LKEIYAADGGWFQARWHFSFDQYHDPQQVGVGALRVFNDDRLQPGGLGDERLGGGDAAKLAGPEELEVTGVGDAELILIEVPLQFRPIGVWAANHASMVPWLGDGRRRSVIGTGCRSSRRGGWSARDPKQDPFGR